MTTRERKEARLARRLEWADKRAAKAEHGFAHAMDGLPDNGQPILVGHHSEKRHRGAIAKADNRIRKAFADQTMAQLHTSKAGGIADQLDSSIYSDDVDAVERLAERIAGLEAERDRYKAQSAACRKRKGQPVEVAFAEMIRAGIFTEAEAKDLIFVCSCFRGDPLRGWPSYKLSNLSGDINRNRKRLEALSGTAKAPEKFICWETTERYHCNSNHGHPTLASARRCCANLAARCKAEGFEARWEVRKIRGMNECFETGPDGPGVLAE